MEKPIIAIMYDFDKTLCTRDMQDYSFIPSIGMTPTEFWQKANETGKKLDMDSVLAYMYTMLKESKERNIPLKRESLVEKGNGIELFPGVKGWFDRINSFGAEQGVVIEHYVISSGLREIIEGSEISRHFKEIYACEFVYDERGNGVFPKTAVNYTNKTQFVYRINKGVLAISNDIDLNKSMPDDSKRIPFSNMIYIGDGLSDVPCMKMMKSYGGTAIAVYQGEPNKVTELLKKDRVDFIYPADYREDTSLDKTVKNIIKKIAVTDILTYENARQLKSLE
ncbi:MAG: HAD family hydrolase [Acutalibacteraceae bacterium]